MQQMRNWLQTGAVAVTIVYVALVAHVAWAALGELVFSVSTDKTVYKPTEPIRIEAIATNPSDTFWTITSASATQNAISVIDLGVNRYVYNSPLTILSLTYLTAHAQVAFAAHEIPAGQLPPGKYKVLLSVYANLTPTGGTAELFQTDASRIITVR